MRLRPESSVSPDTDEYGELCFPGVNHGQVVHRTPEELGISRVVVDDAPGRLMPWIDRSMIVRVRRAQELPDGERQRALRVEMAELKKG
jgi:hypothetical protein